MKAKGTGMRVFNVYLKVGHTVPVRRKKWFRGKREGHNKQRKEKDKR